MRTALLLFTRDANLELRVRRALPVMRGHEIALTAAGSWGGAAVRPPAPGWLLALVDVRAAGQAGTPPPFTQGGTNRPLPLLWLGEAPLLTAGLPAPEDLPGPVIDFLDRNLPVSKLAFILQQHLTAAYLRFRHLPREIQSSPGEVHVALNNALTGILGNAELAAELARAPARRVPPPLTERLECIVELATRMRALMNATDWGDHEALPVSGS
ncbi:MAG: hypothetical protein EPN33_05025 [Acidobacteria bacterium]|nr:MAG: hypothetical protein EPN33_05025 [Acidobacteriota bacterium]